MQIPTPGSRGAQLLLAHLVKNGISLDRYSRDNHSSVGRLSRIIARKPDANPPPRVAAPLDIVLLGHREWGVPHESWTQPAVKGAASEATAS